VRSVLRSPRVLRGETDLLNTRVLYRELSLAD
jgi:hypothetical protein